MRLVRALSRALWCTWLSVAGVALAAPTPTRPVPSLVIRADDLVSVFDPVRLTWRSAKFGDRRIQTEFIHDGRLLRFVGSSGQVTWADDIDTGRMAEADEFYSEQRQHRFPTVNDVVLVLGPGARHEQLDRVEYERDFAFQGRIYRNHAGPLNTREFTIEYTGQVLARVEAVHRRDEVATFSIRLRASSGAVSELVTTADHPLWVERAGGFARAGLLRRGDRLKTHDGAWAEILEAGPTGRTETVYNLTVGGAQNYYVGEAGVLAHNQPACALTPYGGPGGGHHVPAKSAFEGAANYHPNAAPAISNGELTRLGVSHYSVTGAQRSGYAAFAETGAPLTWEAAADIETQALIQGGMAADMAAATVSDAIARLKELGVSGPTRIPWSPR